MLTQGIIIAILMTMCFTSLVKYIQSKIKNENIKNKIPNGFIIALIVGLIVIIILSKFNYLDNKVSTIWSFLEAWIIIAAIAGYGKIAGERLIIFVKALLSDKGTQIASAELEIQQLKDKIKNRKDKVTYYKNK